MSFRRKADDLRYGLYNERDEKILNAIRSLPFCENIKKHTDRFAIIDYYSDNALVELKTRKNLNHNQFATGVIGCNKIDEMVRQNLEYNYAVWKYDDGVFYMSINLDDFVGDRYNKKLMVVRRDTGVERSWVFEIPYGEMIKIEV